MSKRKKFAIFLLLLLAGLFVGYWILNPAEPSYQGRSASAWLDDLASPKRDEALAALKAMGTNAVPAIVRKLKESESPWRRKYRNFYFGRLPAYLGKVLPKPKANLQPEDGARAFQAIGPGVGPILIKLLKDQSPSVRAEAAMGLGYLGASKEADIHDAIPALIEALQDQSMAVRCFSAFALGCVGPEAESAVHALIPLLSGSEIEPGTHHVFFFRTAAAQALGKIGPKAEEALPPLRNLLTDNDKYLCVVTAVAIWRIDGDVTNTLPVLIQGLSQISVQERMVAIDVMAEMGPRAKAAVPVLLGELNQPSSLPAIIATDADTGQKITNALKQIDPEAAAKAGVK